MLQPILILFSLFASFFLSQHAFAQKLGGDGSQQKYMGHIERYDPTPKAPEGSNLPGNNEHVTQPETTAQPSDINIPDADFGELSLDRTDTIIEIIDPITIRAENTGIIRLVGLDIPDYNPYQQGAIAESATNILRDMLAGKIVKLYQTKDRQTGRKNRMNQSLYHVVIDDSGSWVQGALVRLGLARVRTDPSNPEMARALYAMEELARSDKLGLWAFDIYKIFTPEEAAEQVNTFSIIEGTVISAARKQNNIFLNFGNNWRDDFTISVKPINNKRFTKANMNLLDLNGKRIRVRGWVDSYNGPHIEIDHPERIEVISP